jgi:hypothetical protein
MIKDRLTIFFKSVGWRPSVIEKELSIANGLLSKKSSALGTKVLEKLHLKFPELNMDWVITGRGEMLMKDMSNETTDLLAAEHQEGYRKGDDERDKLIALLQENLRDKDKIIALLEGEINRSDKNKDYYDRPASNRGSKMSTEGEPDF